MRGDVLAAVTLLACAGPACAAAPSFDCAKATTADERLVCADPALAQADANLAGVYHTVMDALRPGATPTAREVFETSERSWLRFAQLACSTSKAQSSKDRAACLSASYRGRAHRLLGSERKFGLYDVLRVHAYALIQLDPATSEQADQAGPAIERETYDYIQNASGFPQLAKGAETWNAWITPKDILSGATHYAVDPKRDATGLARAYRAVQILDATEQVIVYKRIVFDDTTLRGSDTDDYGVWLLTEARRARLSDLFIGSAGWSAVVARRVNADTGHEAMKPVRDEGSDSESFMVSADGLGIDSGHIDGFAQPQHMTIIAWADLQAFLSEKGRRIVESFSADRHSLPRDP